MVGAQVPDDEVTHSSPQVHPLAARIGYTVMGPCNDPQAARVPRVILQVQAEADLRVPPVPVRCIAVHTIRIVFVESINRLADVARTVTVIDRCISEDLGGNAQDSVV